MPREGVQRERRQAGREHREAGGQLRGQTKRPAREGTSKGHPEEDGRGLLRPPPAPKGPPAGESHRRDTPAWPLGTQRGRRDKQPGNGTVCSAKATQRKVFLEGSPCTEAEMFQKAQQKPRSELGRSSRTDARYTLLPGEPATRRALRPIGLSLKFRVEESRGPGSQGEAAPPGG